MTWHTPVSTGMGIDVCVAMGPDMCAAELEAWPIDSPRLETSVNAVQVEHSRTFQNILEDSRRFQKQSRTFRIIRGHSRVLQNIQCGAYHPENSRAFGNILGRSRGFQNILEHPIQTILEYSRTLQSLLKRSRTFQNTREHSGTFLGHFRIFQNIQYGADHPEHS